MKHRLTVPFARDPEDADALHEFLHRHGWRPAGWTISHRLGQPAGWIAVTITPPWGAGGVELRAVSGTTLVFDDAEQSMGATWIAEPHDAAPPQPPVASVRRSFVETYTDLSLIQGPERSPRRRWRGR